MRHFFLALLCSYCLALPLQGADQTQGASQIQWRSDYEQVMKEAAASQKPIVLFFTGDWCVYCQRLKRQALDTREFAEIAASRFLFAKIDWPEDETTLPPALRQDNAAMRKKYNVLTYPTLIILAPNGQQVGKTGYRPGGGKDYAEHLLNFVKNAQTYQQQLSQLKELSSFELEQLYKRARDLGYSDDLTVILNTARQSDSPFFLQERYRLLAAGGELSSSEAKEIKAHVLNLNSPSETQQRLLELAIIEFDALSDSSHSAETAILPLLDYLHKFGDIDSATAWRLEMMISQRFLDENKPEQALNYAKSSYKRAPSDVRSDIAHTIRNIQTELCLYH